MKSFVLIQNIFICVGRGGVHHWDEIYKKIQKKTLKKYNIAFYKKYKRRLSSSEKSAQSGNWSHRRSMLMQAPEARGQKIIIFVFSIHVWIQYGR